MQPHTIRPKELSAKMSAEWAGGAYRFLVADTKPLLFEVGFESSDIIGSTFSCCGENMEKGLCVHSPYIIQLN